MSSPNRPLDRNRPSHEYLSALGEELRIASRMLNKLAFELTSDPDIVRRHMDALQQVDLVTQIQLQIADLLQSPCSDEEHSAISLEAMAERLRAVSRC